MAASLPQLAARFGFRTDQGRIDAKTWRQGTLVLAVPLAVLTLIWFLLSPFAHVELGSSSLLGLEIFAAYLYLLLYGFAVLLIAISHYNLSAKRWRDRGWRYPGALAGLLPLAALCSGAAHLVQPRVADVMPYWQVLGADAALLAIVAWNAVELGWLGGTVSE
jgi:uncharacterized membrane protein YhaH (DUF805 family)